MSYRTVVAACTAATVILLPTAASAATPGAATTKLSARSHHHVAHTYNATGWWHAYRVLVQQAHRSQLLATNSSRADATTTSTAPAAAGAASTTDSAASATDPAVIVPTASPSATPSPVAVSTPRLAPIELAVVPGLYDTAGMNRVLDAAVKAGAQSIYTVANWNSLAPTSPRSYDWSALDRLAAAAQARHLGLRFQLTSTPDWVHPALVSAGVGSYQRSQTPPMTATELAQFRTFAGDVAGRYAGAVSKFEIWNEPNEPTFFQPGPDPAKYVQVLKAGYEGVKASAPDSQVLFAGISRGDLGFLSAFYKAADAIPGVPANHWFDTLDVHPYSGSRGPAVNDPGHVYTSTFGTMDENFQSFVKMHDLMAAHGEGSKHVFLGEYGFSTTSNQWTTAVPDSTRATYIGQAYRIAGGYSWVDGMNWYSMMATQWDDPSWTLMSQSFAPTKTYEALVALQS